MDTVFTELKNDQNLRRKRLRKALSAKIELLGKSGHFANISVADLMDLVCEEIGQMIVDYPRIPPLWWLYVLRTKDVSIAEEDIKSLVETVTAAREKEERARKEREKEQARKED